MLRAINNSANIDEYLKYTRSGKQGVELFAPRQGDYALLRIDHSYRLGVDRKSLTTTEDRLELIELIAALRRLKQYDLRQDFKTQLRADVYDPDGTLECELCEEAKNADRLESTSFRKHLSKVTGDPLKIEPFEEIAPVKKDLPSDALPIFRTAIESGWPLPCHWPHNDNGGRGNQRSNVEAEVLAQSFTIDQKLLAYASINDALGWIVSRDVLKTDRYAPDCLRKAWIENYKNYMPDTTESGALDFLAASWCLESSFDETCQPEKRLDLYDDIASNRAFLVILGDMKDMTDFMAALFLDRPETKEPQSAPVDHHGFKDSQCLSDSESQDQEAQERPVPVPSETARVGMFFDNIEALKSTNPQDYDNLDAIGLEPVETDELKDALKIDDDRRLVIIKGEDFRHLMDGIRDRCK